ncbi:DUF1192 domain-containing protein [uncultured Sphingomonas sp.]|uniref:DUF1192 domain-containing protein n=1 Tax=uncultured Sphingomonas sp. TaxID=158754 RepID=UPI0026378CD8|nr:DUF1192 domain-containing protein [uncultured Sphingomonas sp.]
MDLDDILGRRGDDPLTALLAEDLDRLSVAELEARVTALQGEIARCRAKIDGAVSHRASADALFKSGFRS